MRIGWLLVGDERVASSRLQGYAIHRELLRRGHHSRILNAPVAFDTRLHWRWYRRWYEVVAGRWDLVVFQKVESSRAIALARLLRRVGTRIVVAQADPIDSPLYRVADRVVTSSESLAAWIRERCQVPVEVIDEPIDLAPRQRTATRPRSHALRAVFVGSKHNFAALDSLQPVLATREFQDIELLTISDHERATHRWSPATVSAVLGDADIGLLPCLDSPEARLKSANRLVLLAGSGLPTIASSIPSYQPLFRARAAIPADAPQEWAEALRSLREPSVRSAWGERAWQYAQRVHDLPRVAARWERLFAELLRRPT